MALMKTLFVLLQSTPIQWDSVVGVAVLKEEY